MGVSYELLKMNIMFQSELFMNKEIWLNMTAKECLQTHCDSFSFAGISFTSVYLRGHLDVGRLSLCNLELHHPYEKN